ncbi:phage integrase central domain-containing protein, partial [Enterobacter hormaechei]|uniref:phage integrase central domain-containing protein n=1 Tax=Enterobacter hormaechei TaxID=158836 RepID=UPI003CC75629
HRSRVLRYLELYIFPYIGSSDIRQLKTSHLLAPIKKVDASGKHDVEWHVSNKRWSEDHRSRVLRYLELYIFPYIGSSDIRQLKTSHLLA